MTENQSAPKTGTPASPGAANELAVALGKHRANDLVGAAEAYRAVLRDDPNVVVAVAGLARILAVHGRVKDSLDYVGRMLALAPDEGYVHREAAEIYVEFGRWADAAGAFSRAIDLDPSDHLSITMLGRMLAETGRRDDAASVLRHATVTHPFHAAAYYELGRVLYDTKDLRPAIEAFTLATLHDAELLRARFALGVCLAQKGDAKAAEAQFAKLRERGAYLGAIDSFRYAVQHATKATRYFAHTRDTLLYGIEKSPADGLVLELGVRYAISTRVIASRVPRVHGFDSFEGLPEAWHVLPAGAYTMHGELPEVPSNVELHVGLFADTLPPFLAKYPGPFRYVNVDCDIYSSTKCALDLAAERIQPGTVLVFDEYLINDRWRDDEHKALQEFAAERSVRYEYLAFSFFAQQAVVRIL